METNDYYQELVAKSKAKLADIKPEDIDSYDIIQLKYDGFWTVIDIEGFTTTVVTANGFIRNTFGLKNSYKHTQLICEWMYGTNWGVNYKAMNNVEFVIHDAIMIDGEDISYANYMERFGQAQDWMRNSCNEPGFKTVETWYPREDPKTFEKVWQDFVVEEGFEGLVFKSSLDLLQTGRIKRDVSADYIFMGVNPGNGKYLAVAGSIRAGLLVDGVLTYITSVGGLSAMQRDYYWQMRDELAGKMVFEAQGKALFDSGALRHPHFVRERPDKAVSECVFNK